MSAPLSIRPWREAVAAAVMVFAVSALGLGVTYYFGREAQLEAVRNELAQLARVAAAQVDGDAHRRVATPELEGTPEFLATLAPLVRFHRATRDVIYVYTLTLDDGIVRFGVDNALVYKLPGDNESHDPPGTPYPTNDRDARRALETRTLIVNEQVTHEAVRSYLSAYAPFWDAQGGFVGVVGVDMWVRDLDARLAGLFWRTAAASVGLCVIAVLTGALVFRLRASAVAAEVRNREAVVELAAARDAAEASNRAKSAFLAMMSHELRTPLNAIIGYSEMIEEEFEHRGEAMLAADVRRVVSASRHLTSIIGDILDYSKLEAGRIDIDTTPVDVAALAAEVLELMRPGASGKGVDVRLEVDRTVGPVAGDTVRLRQVLLNLIGNAVRFTDRGAVIVRLRTTRTGRLVCAVHDTGAGIPADKRSRLFQPFSQVDSSSTRAASGTGLGLAISLRLVELMRGRLTMRSREGHGSTFRLSLPVDAA